MTIAFSPGQNPAPVSTFKNPHVALVGGQWGQNVGNAFFNLGGQAALTRVFGQGAVQFHQDQPNYRTLHNKFDGNPANYADTISELEITTLILQGPVLNAWLGKSWAKTFETLRRRGVRIIFHSAAFFKFTQSEFASVKGFLEDFPPHAILTRDPKSHAILKSWFPKLPIHNGVDAGFFLPEAVTPFARHGAPTLTLNFDRYPEPDLAFVETPRTRHIALFGQEVFLSTPRMVSWLSHKSKIMAYAGDLLDRRRLPSTWSGRVILRPEHRFFPHMTRKIYRHPGAFCSDEPWTYASVYANSETTLSDRVHACVATLAYGNPAMLFTPSPRAALFERLGLGDIKNRPVSLDPGLLEEAKSAQLRWLANHV